jgi:hypothetical protein
MRRVRKPAAQTRRLNLHFAPDPSDRQSLRGRFEIHAFANIATLTNWWLILRSHGAHPRVRRLRPRAARRARPEDCPFPAEPLRVWPISTRVNKPDNDDPSVVEPIELATSAA